VKAGLPLLPLILAANLLAKPAPPKPPAPAAPAAPTFTRYELGWFCPNDKTWRQNAVPCPSGLPPLQGNNAAAIVKVLSLNAKFDLLYSKDNEIVILCKEKITCAPSDLKDIEKEINDRTQPPNNPTPPYLEPLPYFCLSGTLQEAPAHSRNCVAPKLVRASKDLIQTALKNDPDFVLTDGGDARLLVACKSGSPCVKQQIRAKIVHAAKPSPAYIQDVDVPAGAAGTIAGAIKKAGPLGITAEAIGSDRIRLGNDAAVSAKDVAAILQPYLYGGSPPPVVRMFYQLPTVVVPAANPSSSASNSTSNNASSSPNNSSNNSPATPGNATTPANNTGSPAPGNSPGANPSGSQQPSSSQTSAGGGAGSTSVTFAVKSQTSTSTDSGAADTGGAPAGNGGKDATNPSAPAVTTTTTATITPPPAAPSSPTPPQIIKDMVAVNDNVVFTNTSDDSLVWQRARLLTLLDLPRPEVLMNVWSYEATSPDGREILRSAEKVRDLVTAQNDALQNSIQFGWAYLSREMEKHVACKDPCQTPPEQGPQPATEFKPPAGQVDDPLLIFLDLAKAKEEKKHADDEERQADAEEQWAEIWEWRAAHDAVAAKERVLMAKAELHQELDSQPAKQPTGHPALQAETPLDKALQALKEAQDHLDRALHKRTVAQVKLTTAKERLQAVSDKFEAAQRTVENLKADPQALLKYAQQKLEDAQAARADRDRQFDLQQAQDLLNKAQDLNKAQEASSLPDGLQPVRDALESLMKPLSGALEDLKGAEGNDESEKSKLDDARTKLGAAQKELTDALAALNSQPAGLKSAKSSLERADQALQDAANDLRDAPAKNKAERQKLEDAWNKLCEAQNGLRSVRDGLEEDKFGTAQEALRDAQEAFTRLDQGNAEKARKEALREALDALRKLTPPARLAKDPFFNTEFYNYITQKFATDDHNFLGEMARQEWGFCPSGRYCLGFTEAFQPVRPNLTSILLGAIASDTPLKTMLTTIGCMEGKYEVYPECFPRRSKVSDLIQEAKILREAKDQTSPKCPGCDKSPQCSSCDEVETAKEMLRNDRSKLSKKKAAATPADETRPVRACLRDQRHKLIDEKRYRDNLSCETLDQIALEAQDRCGVPQTLPLSCFTLQAAQSFSAGGGDFSTFTLKSLNELAEVRLADVAIEAKAVDYRNDRVGLLRAAIADFLFNYKISQEYPKEFTPYNLQHSAQELNAELNPLVVSFNQDVAACSRHLSDRLEAGAPNQTSFAQLWRNQKSFLSDGIITVRGIGGDQSMVDTQTQNFFKVTQPKSLSDILNAVTGQGAGASSSTTAVMSALQAGALTPAAALSALAAITPTTMQAQIGRQLTFTVTPYTLPGASSAELAVSLIAGDSAPPALYQSGAATSLTDPLSHIAKFNVSTRVRVESVKMFDLSSFSALVQRPRNKVPLLPPLIELPWVGSFARLPLPGAKQYHRSTAIVSAVIVPTATDLAYGLEFTPDRQVTPRLPEDGPTGETYQLRSVISLSQFKNLPIRTFHKAMVDCFATKQEIAFPGGYKGGCHGLTFDKLPREF